jgi:hypothetical protein
MAFSNLVAFSIILTTAATLYGQGIHNIQSSAQAAEDQDLGVPQPAAVQAELHSPLWQAGLLQPPGRELLVDLEIRKVVRPRHLSCDHVL